MNQPMSQATPKEVISEPPKRTYKVQSGGEVWMTETQESLVKFDGREFLTFIRQHEVDIQKINVALGDEARDKVLKNRCDLKKALTGLLKLQPKVEAGLKDAYDKARSAGLINACKEHLSRGKEPDRHAFLALWSNNPDMKVLIKKSLDAKQNRQCDLWLVEGVIKKRGK